MARDIRAAWLATPGDDATDLLALVGIAATEDAATWRMMALAALDALRQATGERDELRARYHAALDELRAARPRGAA